MKKYKQAISQQQVPPEHLQILKPQGFRSKSLEKERTEQKAMEPAVRHAQDSTQKEIVTKEILSLNTYSEAKEKYQQAVSKQLATSHPSLTASTGTTFRSRTLEREEATTMPTAVRVRESIQKKDAPAKELLSLNTYNEAMEKYQLAVSKQYAPTQVSSKDFTFRSKALKRASTDDEVSVTQESIQEEDAPAKERLSLNTYNVALESYKNAIAAEEEANKPRTIARHTESSHLHHHSWESVDASKSAHHGKYATANEQQQIEKAFQQQHHEQEQKHRSVSEGRQPAAVVIPPIFSQNVSDSSPASTTTTTTTYKTGTS
ncbi:unnamed protein product [Gongylonema pulchrum]|uniref:Nebulin n=1 Tax=Gongylonema pulchrum TaxID=637853 RepID=A0A183EAB9_9BILA|nr:unnamed protein product [Gongylonema pulchrum]